MSVVHDVTLIYKGNTILELDESNSKLIKTANKYLEDDIELDYVKSGGGGVEYNILKGTTQPSTEIGQDGDMYLQYSENQNDIVSSFVKVNGAWQSLVGSDVDDVTDSGMYTGINAPPPSSLGSDGDYYYQRSNLQRSIQSVTTSAPEGSQTTAYGNEFTVTEPVTVKSLFAKTVDGRTGKIQLGTTSEILVETESVTFPANEWVEVALQSPIQLTPGTNYLVKVNVNNPGGYGRIAYFYYGSINVIFDSKISYVRARYGTSWPGTTESPNRVLVGIAYPGGDGLYRIKKQFHKDSGSWSEIT